MTRERIAFITLTNKGYLSYTLNCLESLRKIRANKLHTYCIGRDAFETIERRRFQASLIDDESSTDFQTFRVGNWADVIFYKFRIIHENLLKYDFVCFTDGDIVYKDPAFMEYCEEQIGEHDLLIQNDTQDDNSDENLCSGFMFIKSNSKTKKLFDPSVVRERANVSEGWGDQIYINDQKGQVSFKTLPLDLFPNGKYYIENREKIRPYLIHFNYLIGHSKASLMIRYGEVASALLRIRFMRDILSSKFKKLF